MRNGGMIIIMGKIEETLKQILLEYHFVRFVYQMEKLVKNPRSCVARSQPLVVCNTP
jgi:hypothetical protein